MDFPSVFSDDVEGSHSLGLVLTSSFFLSFSFFFITTLLPEVTTVFRLRFCDFFVYVFYEDFLLFFGFF